MEVPVSAEGSVGHHGSVPQDSQRLDRRVVVTVMGTPDREQVVWGRTPRLTRSTAPTAVVDRGPTPVVHTPVLRRVVVAQILDLRATDSAAPTGPTPPPGGSPHDSPPPRASRIVVLGTECPPFEETVLQDRVRQRQL